MFWYSCADKKTNSSQIQATTERSQSVTQLGATFYTARLSLCHIAWEEMNRPDIPDRVDLTDDLSDDRECSWFTVWLVDLWYDERAAAAAVDEEWSLVCDVSDDMQRRGGFGEFSEKLVAGLLCWLLPFAVTTTNQQPRAHPPPSLHGLTLACKTFAPVSTTDVFWKQAERQLVSQAHLEKQHEKQCSSVTVWQWLG